MSPAEAPARRRSSGMQRPRQIGRERRGGSGGIPAAVAGCAADSPPPSQWTSHQESTAPSQRERSHPHSSFGARGTS
eukprot:7391430-Prymnesium_polylepis.1